MTTTGAPGNNLISLTASIVSAYVTRNSLTIADLPALITTTYAALGRLGAPAEPEPVRPQPPVPIRKTVAYDHTISLEDGRKYKASKRHLNGRRLTVEEYRHQRGLPPVYPMVCEAYAKTRSDLAKSNGLGQSFRAGPWRSVPGSARSIGVADRMWRRRGCPLRPLAATLRRSVPSTHGRRQPGSDRSQPEDATMPPDDPSAMPDDDRPSVLAHDRFLARREAFAHLSLKDRFQLIHDHNLWGAETSASGLGSEAGATRAIRDGLPGLLAGLGIATLLDAPCGDAGWITRVDLGGIHYIGVDIVADLITRNRTGHPPRFEFHVADITCDVLPRADAILCRDCLVHLSFANIGRALANFRRSGARWLVTTTFTQWQHNRDCEDGDWRALNFAREPFAWGPPARLVSERCDEGDGGWRDKSLAVWDLAATVRP